MTAAVESPAIAGWMGSTVPELHQRIVRRAFHDIGICEMPPGSNRSGRIDQWVSRAGSPLGSYWCACWATAVWADCGAAVPPRSRGSNDVIRDWAEEKGLWYRTPVEGALVLYGTPAPGGGWKMLANGKPDAVHIGIVIRQLPYLISIEGNAPWGGGFGVNGEAVIVRRINTDRVLGYVHPTEV